MNSTEIQACPGTGNPAKAPVDPITVEVIRHALIAIPGQIDANIVNTAYSPLIYEYKDYAVGIVDHEGRLLSQSRGALPIFVANALGVAVQDGLATYGRDGIADGDVIFSNHSGTLGQHLNNVVMYTPIFVGPDKSDLFGFMAVVVHWIDVGGASVGSVSPFATEIFQEGVQFRSVRLWRQGVADAGVYKTIECNTRFPEALMGDVGAQLAGCVRGAKLVAGVVEKYGVGVSRAAVEWIWDSSERASRAAIQALPDGDYSAESYLDDDGLDLETPILTGAAISVRGDTITIDLSRTAPQTKGPINSGREGGAVAAARIAFKYLVAAREPPNEGTFRPIKIVIPDGTFLSAGATAAMGYYSGPLPTVVDTILKALAPASGAIAAGHHGNFGAHIFSGIHPETGSLYQNVETALGGWGATSGKDGVGPFKTMCHGDTLDVPIEVQEALYPLTVESYEFRQDSGGAGKFRGGLGLTKCYRIEAPCELRVMQERKLCPPWGVRGGAPGATATTILKRPGEEPRELRKAVVDLRRGDRIEIYSGGGGGNGDPRHRDPEHVAADVRKGFVSREAAAKIYGVALDE